MVKKIIRHAARLEESSRLAFGDKILIDNSSIGFLHHLGEKGECVGDAHRGITVIRFEDETMARGEVSGLILTEFSTGSAPTTNVEAEFGPEDIEEISDD